MQCQIYAKRMVQYALDKSIAHLQFHVGDVTFAWPPLNAVERFECCLKILNLLYLKHGQFSGARQHNGAASSRKDGFTPCVSRTAFKGLTISQDTVVIGCQE